MKIYKHYKVKEETGDQSATPTMRSVLRLCLKNKKEMNREIFATEY